MGGMRKILTTASRSAGYTPRTGFFGFAAYVILMRNPQGWLTQLLDLRYVIRLNRIQGYGVLALPLIRMYNGKRRKQLSKMMDQTTWMNANRALELGFIDGILEDEKKASAPYQFSESMVEDTLVNKMSERFKVARPAAKAEVTEGRKVDDLKASLYKKLL